MAKKRVSDTDVPVDAVLAKRSGGWVFLISKSERAIYINSADAPTLRVSVKELQDLYIGVKALIADLAGLQKMVQTKTPRHKRHFKRYIRRCEAEFTCGNVTNRGIASDFSFNGMFIRTNHPFPPESILDVLVHLPDGTISRIKGRVKRAMNDPVGRMLTTPERGIKNGMGLELLKKDTGYLHFMRELLGSAQQGSALPGTD